MSGYYHLSYGNRNSRLNRIHSIIDLLMKLVIQKVLLLFLNGMHEYSTSLYVALPSKTNLFYIFVGYIWHLNISKALIGAKSA